MALPLKAGSGSPLPRFHPFLAHLRIDESHEVGKAVDKTERRGETWQSSTPTEAHLSYVELQSKNIQQSLGVLIKENKWKKEAETHIFNLLLPAAEMRLHRKQKN